MRTPFASPASSSIQTPEVGFILVNYHSEDHTRRCVASILALTRGVSFEIVVIDNHSGLDAAALQKDFPNVRVLLSPQNLGFGLANNVASSFSKTRYLFFLNNDCVLLNDAATVLYRWMNATPEAGLCGAQLLEPSGRSIASFDYFPTLSTRLFGVALFRRMGWGRFPRKDGSLREPTEVDLVSGASMFIRADLFRRLGQFDPRFFLYCEEEDLAQRVWKSGHRVYLVPAARIEHVGGGSSQNVAALKKEFYISFFYFYRKHYGTLAGGVIRVISGAQIFIRWLTRPEKTVWKSLCLWFLRGTPEQESLRYAPGNKGDSSPSQTADQRWGVFEV